jgi:tetratricopeptide (TPR) repeat protein
LTVLCLALLPGAARADVSSGLKDPYRLRIVLDVAEHRFLTPVFKDQVEREVLAHLQFSFGELAEITVQRTHELLPEVRSKGLRQALDGWEELADVQTHFVLIDFEDGHYTIQARHHDGLTGLAGPTVLHDQTTDRQLVARQAAALVERGFGLVGTVVSFQGQSAKVELRGGGLGVPLQRWLRPGDVFAVARITRSGERARANRLEWAALQVEGQPQEGACHCRFYARFQQEQLTDEPGVAYRCLRLATLQAPLRLRLVHDQTGKPVDDVEVEVRRLGFDGKAEKLAPAADGLVVTREAYSQLAFVQVYGGARLRAQFPVALVDDRPVLCRLVLGTTDTARELDELRKDSWVRRIYESLLVANDRVTELNAVLTRSLEEARDRAQLGLKALKEEERTLTQVQQQLRQKAGLDLSEGDQQLRQLTQRREDLERFIVRLNDAIKQKQSERELRTLIERARLQEDEAAYEQAIELYEEVLKKDPAQKTVADHLGQLKRDWQVRGPEHFKAREFIYATWPKLDTAGLKARLDDARKAFARCREAGDVLTSRKLLLANVAHTNNLIKRREVLKNQESVDARAEREAILQVADGLRQLHTAVSDYLRQTKEAAK